MLWVRKASLKSSPELSRKYLSESGFGPCPGKTIHACPGGVEHAWHENTTRGFHCCSPFAQKSLKHTPHSVCLCAEWVV